MFKLLKTFQAVYETLNFSHAAQLLFLSQPAVSNQIKQLENDLGVQLFLRSGRQEMLPTKQATILYDRSLTLLDEWQATTQAIQLESQAQIVCRICTSHTFASYLLPKFMRELLLEFPHIHFKIDLCNSNEALEKLKKHEADLGFIEKPLETPGIERTTLMKDQLVVAGNRESDLWLVRENTSGVYHYTQRYFQEQNIQERKLEVTSNEVILALLKEGIGRSVISRRAVPQEVPFKTLDFWRNFYLIQRANLKTDNLLEVAEKIVELSQSYSEKNE
ncbi:MAG: LysR family transcriptional regulator [Enterococcus sp.]